MLVTSSSNSLNRTQWAGLDWKEAQVEVAKLLNENNFMVFEEKRIGNHKRLDVLAIQNTENRIVFGVIEIKCYRRITPKLQKNAMIQGCLYLQHIYPSCENQHKWGKKERKYFVATVFTNDYPGIYTKHSLTEYSDYLPQGLMNQENIQLLSCSPDRLIEKLQNYGLAMRTQTSVEDFFD